MNKIADILIAGVIMCCSSTYHIAQNIGGVKLWRSVHSEGKTLVSVPLHFNVLIMFGWEKFGELTDTRQIHQCFPPPTFCAIRYTVYTLHTVSHSRHNVKHGFAVPTSHTLERMVYSHFCMYYTKGHGHPGRYSQSLMRNCNRITLPL